jgi:hypothetical protein
MFISLFISSVHVALECLASLKESVVMRCEHDTKCACTAQSPRSKHAACAQLQVSHFVDVFRGF